MAPVTINHNTIDLDPTQHPAGYFATDATDSNHVLIQYSRVPSIEDHDGLDKLGALVIHRIGEHTLLSRYLPSDLGPIKTLPFVQHAVVYHPDFVVSPLIKHAKEKGGRVAVGAYVHFASAETGSDVWDTIRTTIDPDARLIGHGEWSVKLWIKREKLAEVSALDYVSAIEPMNQYELHSDMAVPAILSGQDIFPPWPTGTPPDGSGEIVAVADTGYGNGTRNGHPMLPASRIVNMKYAGDTSTTDPLMMRDDWNHGTAVAGCVAASWDLPTLKNETSAQAKRLCSRLTGTAPGASLFIIRCFDTDPTKPDTPLANLDNLWTIPYNDERAVAKIYNCSWASKVPVARLLGSREVHQNIGYGPSASVIDASAIDDTELLILFAAGNKGDELFEDADHALVLRQSVKETCAKNIMVVGMTYNARWYETFVVRSDGYPILEANTVLDGDGSFQTPEDLQRNKGKRRAGGVLMLNVGKYFFQSSRGPTESGLLKPDVVAPGAGIFAASSKSTLSSANPPRGASATPSADDAAFFVGSSFATPFVAGMAADLRAVLRTGVMPVRVAQPPGMLIKALIVNGAEDLMGTRFEWFTLDGELGTGTMPASPNFAVGYGLANLRRALVPLTNDGGGIWGGTLVAADTPLTQDLAFPTTNGDRRSILRVTLTWADVPGVDINNLLQLTLAWTKPDASTGTLEADPLQPLPYEQPSDPPRRPTMVQRITLRGALQSAYTKLTVRVRCGSSIIPYIKNGEVKRRDQPFAVAYGFYPFL